MNMEKGDHRMCDNIKLLISYHKESEILKSGIMIPIHVGAKNSSLHLDMVRDDEGDNISEKNDRYCELTAQYWAWKNLEADYYGFMHYRRQFVFRKILPEAWTSTAVECDKIDEDYKKAAGLYDEEIRNCLKNYDLVLPYPADSMSQGALSNEIFFSSFEAQHARDFHTVCETVSELYPEYEPYVLKFRTGHLVYWCNMFIMRKELFMEYSSWLFFVLESAERRIEFTGYNSQETRVLAFMAERLFSIYVMKLLDDRPWLKVKHLKVTKILYTDAGEAKAPAGYESMVREGRKKAGLLEKSYRELKQIALPYDMEEVFTIKESKWEKLLHTKKIVFYGGGFLCGTYLGLFERLGFPAPVEIWDKKAEEIKNIGGIPVFCPVEELFDQRKDVYVIVTIGDERISEGVKDWLLSKGIVNVSCDKEVLKWLAYQLWMK